MQMIGRFDARKILRNVGMPENLSDAIALNYVVPENVINYAVKLWTHGMRGEQIITLLENSTGTTEILDVRKFFRELGPLAMRFGFTPGQIENDIREFDKDMNEYARELIGPRKLHDICQSPFMLFENTDQMVDMCAAGHGKYYRAGVEFIEWAKRGYESNEKITAILNRCIDSDGINIKLLLRMTTKGTGNTVSRTDGNQIKPHIRMSNINYARDVYYFFYENAGYIRKIARQYTDIDFISAFYNLCVNWPAWSWPIVSDTIRIPDYKATSRDGIEIVMGAITSRLPIDARQMIVNIATHAFTEIVPAAGYEYSWEQLTRRMDPKQQR